MLRNLLLLGLILSAAPASSQIAAGDSTRPVAASADTAALDTAVRSHRVTPKGAFIRSLILPGWGQSEVGAPERGAIYFALEAGSLWMVYKSHQKLGESRDHDAVLRALGELPEGQNSPLTRDRLAQREDWITLSVFWLFFSGADAFVAGYLRDFDEHVGVAPSPTGGTQLQYTVPVGP